MKLRPQPSRSSARHWFAAVALGRGEGLPSAGAAARPTVRFETQEIDKSLKVGYAVLLADVDGDGKTDIVVVDTTRVVWYQNPGWKRRTIIEGLTKPDNVCVAAADIDGDGKLDLVLGADWKPFNTKEGGTLQWLKQGRTLDEPWTVYPIGDEPTVHRIRFADLDGTGRPSLLLAPLMGRNSSKAANWGDGEPVRLLSYKIPADPAKDRWVPEVIDQSLHVVHNITTMPAAAGKGLDILAASYEGVTKLSRDSSGKWSKQLVGAGNQDTPTSNRGASEVKQGTIVDGTPCVVTIEPWHGFQVVAYTPPGGDSRVPGLWRRHVVDDKLRWGHAVWFADLGRNGGKNSAAGESLIVGVRDDPKPGDPRDAGVDPCGVRVYTPLDGSGSRWARVLVDPGGVAVEDLAAADLNGDGRVDIVAVGRRTGNVRIYWNKSK